MAASIKSLPTRFVGARLAPSLQLTDSGFLWSARDGETFSLNESGARLLRALLRGVAPIDVWRELTVAFSLPVPLAQRDAQLFLGRLYNLGLLELPATPEDDADEAGR
jgi:hypothetical protein